MPLRKIFKHQITNPELFTGHYLLLHVKHISRQVVSLVCQIRWSGIAPVLNPTVAG